MLKYSLIENIYRSKEIDDVMLKVKPDHIRDDLKQHVFMLLLEKDECFIVDLHENKKLRNYIVKIIFQLSNFKGDKFHRQNRKTTEISTDFSMIEAENENEDSGLCKQFPIQKSFIKAERDEQSLLLEREMEGVAQVECEKLYWYNQNLLKRYVELKTYRAVAAEVGLPVKSVYNAIRQAKKTIKDKINQSCTL